MIHSILSFNAATNITGKRHTGVLRQNIWQQPNYSERPLSFLDKTEDVGAACCSSSSHVYWFFSSAGRERRRAVPSAEAGHRSLSSCSVGFEIRLLRVSGLAVRKIALQMLILNAAGLQIRPSGGNGKKQTKSVTFASKKPLQIVAAIYKGSGKLRLLIAVWKLFNARSMNTVWCQFWRYLAIDARLHHEKL